MDLVIDAPIGLEPYSAPEMRIGPERYAGPV